MSPSLPIRANLDWLRKTAKERLDALRSVNADATLSDAQLAVAREYGFSSWRALKAHVDAMRATETSADDPDFTKLVKAVRDGDGQVVAALVSARPELVRARDVDGQTPLHIAAEHNDPALGVYLVSAGADLSATMGNSGHTPLSWAVTCRAIEFAAAMAQIGAKPDLFCAAGMGAIDSVQSWFDSTGALKPYASQTGSSRYAPDGSRLPCPPSSARDQISDALYIASRNAHVEIVRWLLTKSPDLEFRAYMGATALHWAFFGGSREVVELLLRAGADSASRDLSMQLTPRAFGICVLANWGFLWLVRAQLSQDPSLAHVFDGTSPLHEAARGGHFGVVKLLLEAGADPARVDRTGQTARALAESKQHDAVASAIRAAETERRT